MYFHKVYKYLFPIIYLNNDNLLVFKKGSFYILDVIQNQNILRIYPHNIFCDKILKNRYCMAEVATSGGKSLIISIVMFYTLKKIKEDEKDLKNCNNRVKHHYERVSFFVRKRRRNCGVRSKKTNKYDGSEIR